MSKLTKELIIQIIDDFYNERHLDTIKQHLDVDKEILNTKLISAMIQGDLQYYIYLVLKYKYNINNDLLAFKPNNNIAEIFNQLDL